MSPRHYEMAKRQASAKATRKRIVEAAARLHARRGTAATTWDDIAAEARVSRATVYHHFGSLDELVPACAQAAFDMIDLPTREEAAARFAALNSPTERLAQFVRDSCRCYAAAAGWLRAAWRERDVVPAMGAAVRRLQKALDILLAAALDGLPLQPRTRDVVATLIDFPFWESLDRAGIPRAQIADHIVSLATYEIEQGRFRR